MRTIIPRLTAGVIFFHLVILLGGRHSWGIPEPIGRFFFMDQEYNLPTFYTSLLLLGCAYFCLRYARLRFYQSRSLETATWSFLGVVLTYLAADEWFALHEKLILPLRESFAIDGGVFYFSWTIAYIGLVIAVGLISLPWLWRLDARLRNWLLLSAGVYIFGALGLEMYGSWVYSTGGFAYTERYANIVTLEESLELIGLTLALLTLARFLPSGPAATAPLSENIVANTN